MNKPIGFKDLPYRNNVSCILFKKKNFLLVQHIKWPENFWKFPQGGIDEGETEEEAARRELLEELGTDKFKFIAKSSHTNKYDWEDESVKLAGFRWRGQIQRFFLVEYLGNDKDIKINKNEFRRYEWVSLKDLYFRIDHNNKDFRNYKETIEKIVEEFKQHFV